jgi:hypothetical protein
MLAARLTQVNRLAATAFCMRQKLFDKGSGASSSNTKLYGKHFEKHTKNAGLKRKINNTKRGYYLSKSIPDKDINIENKLTLTQIREDKSYVSNLNSIILQGMKTNGFITLLSLIDVVHSICPQLKQYCDENTDNFKVTSVKDKGLIGKIVEFYLFGNLPNSNSCSDTPYGDIKTTHFKSYKSNNNAFNAKERLTLTNFGSPYKEQNIALISDKNSIQDTKFYDKFRKGIILVLQHDNAVYDTIESVYNKQIIAIVHYDLNMIFKYHADVRKVFQSDFDKIKKCIVENNVTQSGQQYLHIHKHGSKDGTTRAFGFTNKFLTKLLSIHLNIPITSYGRSEYIEI